jgi:hypothetical protein
MTSEEAFLTGMAKGFEKKAAVAEKAGAGLRKIVGKVKQHGPAFAGGAATALALRKFFGKDKE